MFHGELVSQSTQAFLEHQGVSEMKLPVPPAVLYLLAML